MEVIVARIDRGKNLMEEIGRIVKEKDLFSSWIVGAIGAVEQAEMGDYIWDEEGYTRFRIEEPMELISSQGNVSEEGVIHMHCSLGNGEKTVSGHMFNAKVNVFVEIAFARLDVKLRRREIKRELKALDVEG